MENYFNNSNLLSIILKWKYHLAAIVIIAAILGVVFSSPIFITPKYKSNAVVYPANISPYSDESETEQMFQILHSQDIKDSVIKEFNLAEHYKVDPTYKYYYTTINYLYNENVSISKTPYDAINIEVMDKDPEIACNMVKAIIKYYNIKVSELHNSKYLEIVEMYKALLARKEMGIDSLKNRLYKLSVDYGLLAYEQTSEQIMRGYLQTIMGATKSNINMKEVLILKKNMEEHGGDLIQLVEEIKNEVRTTSDFRVDYENALRFYRSKLTFTNEVTSPFPSDKKAYPVRWLIVAITVIVTLFFAVILILLFDKYRIFYFGKKQ